MPRYPHYVQVAIDAALKHNMADFAKEIGRVYTERGHDAVTKFVVANITRDVWLLPERNSDDDEDEDENDEQGF